MKNITEKAKKQNNKWHITFEERKMIEKMLNQELSKRNIAKVLWRWKTSVCDEIKRNATFHDGYKAELAHKLFLKKQDKKGNISKIESNEILREYIISQLKEDWSPEEIMGRLKINHNDKDFDTYIWYVCHETIYQFIYSDAWKKVKLPSLLRRHKPKRTKWHSRRPRWIEVIKERVSIKKRDPIIEKRTRVWDFESDSVIFSNQKQVLNTNLCRFSRLARLELVKDKTALSAIIVQKNIVYEMEELWVNVFSFTFDNGWENALHTQLREMGVDTYFCDPYCSYQKGSVENLNLLIRQYLPRNTDLSLLTDHDIYVIQEKLNNRPRKCLWYLTPNEFFYKKTWVKPN